eukprot:gene14086-21565_t
MEPDSAGTDEPCGWGCALKRVRTLSTKPHCTSLLVEGLADGRLYALRRLDVARMSAKERQEAAAEVRQLSSLRHAYVLSCYGSFEERGYLNILTDCADVGTLRHVLTVKADTLKYAKLVEWAVEIALAMQHTHKSELLHRDLTLDTVFITAKNTVKVGEYGLRSFLTSLGDAARAETDSPFFSVPEVKVGLRYLPHSDVFSYASTVKEMMKAAPAAGTVAADPGGAGWGPHDTDPAELPRMHREFMAVIEGMLSPDPPSRPPLQAIVSCSVVQALAPRFPSFLRSELGVSLGSSKAKKSSKLPAGDAAAAHREGKPANPSRASNSASAPPQSSRSPKDHSSSNRSFHAAAPGEQHPQHQEHPPQQEQHHQLRQHHLKHQEEERREHEQHHQKHQQQDQHQRPHQQQEQNPYHHQQPPAAPAKKPSFVAASPGGEEHRHPDTSVDSLPGSARDTHPRPPAFAVHARAPPESGGGGGGGGRQAEEAALSRSDAENSTLSSSESAYLYANSVRLAAQQQRGSVGSPVWPPEPGTPGTPHRPVFTTNPPSPAGQPQQQQQQQQQQAHNAVFSTPNTPTRAAPAAGKTQGAAPPAYQYQGRPARHACTDTYVLAGGARGGLFREDAAPAELSTPAGKRGADDPNAAQQQQMSPPQAQHTHQHYQQQQQQQQSVGTGNGATSPRQLEMPRGARDGGGAVAEDSAVFAAKRGQQSRARRSPEGGRPAANGRGLEGETSAFLRGYEAAGGRGDDCLMSPGPLPADADGHRLSNAGHEGLNASPRDHFHRRTHGASSVLSPVKAKKGDHSLASAEPPATPPFAPEDSPRKQKNRHRHRKDPDYGSVDSLDPSPCGTPPAGRAAWPQQGRQEATPVKQVLSPRDLAGKQHVDPFGGIPQQQQQQQPQVAPAEAAARRRAAPAPSFMRRPPPPPPSADAGGDPKGLAGQRNSLQQLRQEKLKERSRSRHTKSGPGLDGKPLPSGGAPPVTTTTGVWMKDARAQFQMLSDMLAVLPSAGGGSPHGSPFRDRREERLRQQAEGGVPSGTRCGAPSTEGRAGSRGVHSPRGSDAFGANQRRHSAHNSRQLPTAERNAEAHRRHREREQQKTREQEEMRAQKTRHRHNIKNVKSRISTASGVSEAFIANAKKANSGRNDVIFIDTAPSDKPKDRPDGRKPESPRDAPADQDEDKRKRADQREAQRTVLKQKMNEAKRTAAAAAKKSQDWDFELYVAHNKRPAPRYQQDDEGTRTPPCDNAELFTQDVEQEVPPHARAVPRSFPQEPSEVLSPPPAAAEAPPSPIDAPEPRRNLQYPAAEPREDHGDLEVQGRGDEHRMPRDILEYSPETVSYEDLSGHAAVHVGRKPKDVAVQPAPSDWQSPTDYGHTDYADTADVYPPRTFYHEDGANSPQVPLPSPAPYAAQHDHRASSVPAEQAARSASGGEAAGDQSVRAKISAKIDALRDDLENHLGTHNFFTAYQVLKTNTESARRDLPFSLLQMDIEPARAR